MIRFRKAIRDDCTALLDLIDRGFSIQGDYIDKIEGEEHRILFSYLYTRPDWNPEWVFVAEEDGRIVAAAGYFPQTLSFEGVMIPAGAISPVVTDPQYRQYGLARKCLNTLLENLRSMGVPLAFLWGLPFYYPKLGFVPVLPRYKTKITTKELLRSITGKEGKLRECSFQDLKILAELYRQDYLKYWLQPCRNLEWWQKWFHEMDTDFAYIKEVPFPKKEKFLVWENNSGELTGYLQFSSEYFNYIFQPRTDKVVINEAYAIDLSSASAMLKSLAGLIKPEQTIYIRGTPEHPLNAAAYRMGGIHMNPAPLAGMFKVIDWSLFFNLLNPLFQKRLACFSASREFNFSLEVDHWLIEIRNKNHSIETIIKEIPSEVLNHNQLLTRLIFGIYNRFDLEMMDETHKEYLSALFPPKYPFIWDANYLY